MELTEQQIKRQDFVDNAVKDLMYELLQGLRGIPMQR